MGIRLHEVGSFHTFRLIQPDQSEYAISKRGPQSVSFNKGTVKKGAFIRAPLKRASVKYYVQDLLFRIYICKIICSIIYLGYVLHVLTKMQYFYYLTLALFNGALFTAPLLK